jgi:hypothetical protein
MRTARARIATVLVGLGLVAAAWLAGDGGSARAALGQATGPLVATAPGAAILVAEGLAPGDARTGEVTVTNVGDAAGAFVLSAVNLVDSVAPLSEVLALAVDDVTPGRASAPVFAGRLDALSGAALGTLQQGEARRYRLTVSFPSGRPDALDNAYQGASTAVTFVWAASRGEASPTVVGPSEAAPPETRTPGISVGGAQARPGRAGGATLTAAARQRGASGIVMARVACRAGCQWSLSGTASHGAARVRLRTVSMTFAKARALRVRLRLPSASRAALAARRRLTVRLRLRASVGGRAIVVRRTVLIMRGRTA